jgi:tripartite-type tricarboxylate transporter receptor subunit TctC
MPVNSQSVTQLEMSVGTCSRAAPSRQAHSHNATVQPVGAAVKKTAKRIVNPPLVPEGGGPTTMPIWQLPATLCDTPLPQY